MRIVLVTGAGGALGKACVSKLASEGYQVLAVVSPGKKLSYETNGMVAVYHVDLTNEVDTTNLIDTIISNHKTIDAALFLAGGFAMGSISETDGALVKKMIGLNFETAYFASKKIFSKMAQQENGGRLIFVGAKPALSSKEGKDKIAYTLSKSLLFKLAELLNAEGNKKNVVATVVVPSIIDSEANRKGMPKANPSDWVTPDEIATVISFAISEKGEKLREPILKVFGNS